MIDASLYVAPACEIAWCLDGFAEYERELEEYRMRPWTQAEVDALRALANRLGTEPQAILGVMANESGCNPAAHNPGGAVGLIQFETDTLRDLGWTQGADAFAKLDVLEQLPFVERYFSDPHRKPYLGYGVGAVYTAAFLPALTVHANDDAFVLCGANGPLGWAYADNKSFDTDGKGTITVGDLVNAAERALNSSTCGQGIVAMLTEEPDASVADTDPAPPSG